MLETPACWWRTARPTLETVSSRLHHYRAQVEAELKELDPEEAAEYLESLGVGEAGLGSLIRATYRQLGLQTYFTSGPTETRAWTIRAGMSSGSHTPGGELQAKPKCD